MVENPLVTIALATYNVVPYIEECLDRIVNQTYRNLEIICIDDCSTDGTSVILDNLSAIDKRISVIHNEKNNGLSFSRNLAVDLAKGKYLIMVDGDDLMDYDLVEKAVLKAECNNADMVIWDYYEFGYSNSYRPKCNKAEPSSLGDLDPSDRHALVRLMAFTWIRMFKLESLRSISVKFPEGRTKQDQPLHWMSVLLLPKIILLPQRKYGYRISNLQTSYKKGRQLLDIYYVTEITEQLLVDNAKYEEFKIDFIRFRLRILMNMCMSISRKYSREAKKLTRKAINEDYVKILKEESLETRNFYNSLCGHLPLRILYSVVIDLIIFKRYLKNICGQCRFRFQKDGYTQQ